MEFKNLRLITDYWDRIKIDFSNQDVQILDSNLSKLLKNYSHSEIILDRYSILDEDLIKFISNFANIERIYVQLEKNSNRKECLYIQENQEALIKAVNHLTANNKKVVFVESFIHNKNFIHKQQLDITEGYTLNQLLVANYQIDNIVKKIDNAKNRFGKSFSEVEKFILAYNYVVNRFLYKKSHNKHNSEFSRCYISTLTTDEVVCEGFANTLTEISLRLGLNCVTATIDPGVVFNSFHAISSISFDDSKYLPNLKGKNIYYSDPTWFGINSAIFGRKKFAQNYKSDWSEPDSLIDLNSQVDEFMQALKSANSIEDLSEKDRKYFSILLNRLYKSHISEFKIDINIVQEKGKVSGEIVDYDKYIEEIIFKESCFLHPPYEIEVENNKKTVFVTTAKQIFKRRFKQYLQDFSAQKQLVFNRGSREFRELLKEEILTQTPDLSIKDILKELDKDLMAEIKNQAIEDRKNHSKTSNYFTELIDKIKYQMISEFNKKIKQRTKSRKKQTEENEEKDEAKDINI